MVENNAKPIPKKWLALLAMAIVSPIGILLVWDFGDAWGEWGEVGSWVPQQFWSAPLPDYNIMGWDGQMMASVGYILSAFVGIIAVIAVTYLIAAAFRKRGTEPSRK